MGVNTKDNGLKVICMVLVNIKIKMVFGNKDNGKKVKEFLDDNILFVSNQKIIYIITWLDVHYFDF